MNFRLVARQLGIICLLIGVTMIGSLLWAFPRFGRRNHLPELEHHTFETAGFIALVVSILICFGVGILLLYPGRRAQGSLYRKEAMAVVGLSWVLATFLGALPFWFSGCVRGPAIRLTGPTQFPQTHEFKIFGWRQWNDLSDQPVLSEKQLLGVQALLEAGRDGLTAEQLSRVTNSSEVPTALRELADGSAEWHRVLIVPGSDVAARGVQGHFQVTWIKMTFVDALFESQSGFSTTGATVISDLEDPRLVPHCILFWRSSTHFLGGLGIIVLFVVILGQGSAGKALMRAEIPGPSKEGTQTLMQHTAQVFAAIYCGLTALLAILLKIEGLSWFDAFCHSFGTMATGGFSTYNDSIGHFGLARIDYTIIVFMVLAGTNFALLYALFCIKPGQLFSNVEWRTYMALIALVTLLVVLFGLAHDNFDSPSSAIQYGLFQVVAIVTTTGFGTNDFDAWNNFARAVLVLLMFWGGCAGSTGGGMKVIRHILFLKIIRLEVEQSFHPTVIRTLQLGGDSVVVPNLGKNILVYFGLILVIFIFSWMAFVMIEPDTTWASNTDHKLIDSASAIAATLNNIGPGLGIVGPKQNYGHFSWASKLLFTWLMMLGRLEIFVILVLAWPRFWRSF